MTPQTNFDKLAHFPDCDCIQNIDHPSHASNHIHPFPDRLYVVTCLFNPLRYRNRYFNYHTFENMVAKSGAILYTVEIAFGDRHFEITDQNNPHHLQLRAADNQEIWLKENSLNLLINRLPAQAQYIAWIDADVSFVRPDWAQETLHLLQHNDFLQLFSHAQDISSTYQPLAITPGFVYYNTKKQDNIYISQNPNDPAKIPSKESKSTIQTIMQSLGLQNNNDHCVESCIEEAIECIEECGYYYGVERKVKGGKPLFHFYHSGFAWAARRSALNKVGGLIDYCLLGSADWHMAHGLIGQMEKTINIGYSDTYKRLCREWGNRAERNIRRNIGYMSGLINHSWHGKKGNRRYDDRWRLLVETQYDPISDLKKDVQGLNQLNDNGDPKFLALRDGLRRYATLRDEDNPNM